jgi:hypothetical protein
MVRERISHEDGGDGGEKGKSEQKVQTPLTPSRPVGTPRDRRGRGSSAPGEGSLTKGREEQGNLRKRIGMDVTHRGTTAPFQGSNRELVGSDWLKSIVRVFFQHLTCCLSMLLVFLLTFQEDVSGTIYFSDWYSFRFVNHNDSTISADLKDLICLDTLHQCRRYIST